MFILAEGKDPVCLLAHMDTVFTRPPAAFFFDEKMYVLWSPQGLGADDRAGIYTIIKILQNSPFRPSIVITNLEEQGGIGADNLINQFPICPFQDCRALIQLDRRGYTDSVFYNCGNKEFEEKINSYGFQTARGTFSDISIIAPIWGIAAVNLSVGYYNEHSLAEYLNMTQLESTRIKVCLMLSACHEWPAYEYIDEFAGNGVWWSINNCICCGKPLKDDEGHLCHDSKDLSEYKFCDECFKQYF